MWKENVFYQYIPISPATFSIRKIKIYLQKKQLSSVQVVPDVFSVLSVESNLLQVEVHVPLVDEVDVGLVVVDSSPTLLLPLLLLVLDVLRH